LIFIWVGGEVSGPILIVGSMKTFQIPILDQSFHLILQMSIGVSVVVDGFVEVTIHPSSILFRFLPLIWYIICNLSPDHLIYLPKSVGKRSFCGEV